jgi:hypothetical protein
VIIFGSASNGDFIRGYSDLDIFVSINVLEPEKILENLLAIQSMSSDIFAVKNIDYTVIKSAELKSQQPITINPCLYELIRMGYPVVGQQLPKMFSPRELKNDGLYVSATGLRKLRSMMGSLYKMKPAMAYRTIEDLLFTSTRALLVYLTGKIYPTRAEIYDILQEHFSLYDLDIYEYILNLRGKQKRGEKIKLDDYDEFYLRALITYEKIWNEVSK